MRPNPYKLKLKLGDRLPMPIPTTKKINTRPMLVPIAFGALWGAIATVFFIFLLTLASCEAEAGGVFESFANGYAIGQGRPAPFQQKQTRIQRPHANITRQRFGDIEYLNGNIDGERVQCTTQHIGDQSYTNCY